MRQTPILIQAGFSSRLAAIKAVSDTGATFTTGAELRAWLRSPDLAAWSAQPNWPTFETKDMWLEFIQQFQPSDSRKWQERTYGGSVRWLAAAAAPEAPVQIFHRDGQPLVLAADGHPIGVLQHQLNPNRRGLLRTTVSQNQAQLHLSYLGPDDLWTAY